MDNPPAQWEVVLSYVAGHRMHWGTDVVFTYGPLGFIINDGYWGGYFWLILGWSAFFSLVLTVMLLRFLKRLPFLSRIFIYIVVPLLTVPRCLDLGVDPIYLFAITVFGMACRTEEKPGWLTLAACASVLGWLGLFKFTFFIYGTLVLVCVTMEHLLRGCVREAGMIMACAVVAFVVAWCLIGQRISDLGAWFHYSFKIASDYSGAMSLPPLPAALVLGVLVCLSFAGTLGWKGWKSRCRQWPGILMVAAGIFFAWKEGFVRPDPVHRVVFFYSALLMALTVPSFFVPDCKCSDCWTCATVVLSLIPFITTESKFTRAIGTGFFPRCRDTFTAVLAPTWYKHRLEENLAARREQARLPNIASMAGEAPMAVLRWNQDVAILNGFNYRPSPVFESYSAYGPELQRLNAAFYASTNAPDYLLWQYGTLDGRFPTLDEGQVILTVLDRYVPVLGENGFLLWRRSDKEESAFRLANRSDVTVPLGEWFSIPTNATWIRIDLEKTIYGRWKDIVYHGVPPAIEVRLANGHTKLFTLIPGNARSGFIINPLFETATDLVSPFLKGQCPPPERVVAARVNSSGWEFCEALHYTLETIEGIPALDTPVPR